MAVQSSGVAYTGSIPGWFSGYGWSFDTDWNWSYLKASSWYVLWDTSAFWAAGPWYGPYLAYDWNPAYSSYFSRSASYDDGLLDWDFSWSTNSYYVYDDANWAGSWADGDIWSQNYSMYYWSGNDGDLAWEAWVYQAYYWDDNVGGWGYGISDSWGITYYDLDNNGLDFGYSWTWNWSTGLTDTWFNI